MKVSIVITVKNEEKTISKLLDSLVKQSKKPNEIVIIDSNSEDKTVQIIKHFQNKYRYIRLLSQECSRAAGRNIGVDLAKNDIVAMTDAGCVAKRNWLKYISEPFIREKVEVVAGFYDMIFTTNLQKVFSVYLGILPSDFDANFLPSTRSIAFRKSLWEKLGGFPEKLQTTAEDTLFNYKLVKEDVKIAYAKNARVEWAMPKSIREFYWKIYAYAWGDAQSRVFVFPGKGISSHNIKALFTLLRYMLGLSIFLFSFFNPDLFILLFITLVLYLAWIVIKIFYKTQNIYNSILAIVVQVTADMAVVAGLVGGILKTR